MSKYLYEPENNKGGVQIRLMGCTMDDDKLARRLRELEKRKYSFIELIMQVKKKIYKQKLDEHQEELERRGLLIEEPGAD